MRYGFCNQLITVKRHCIRIFVVDFLPKSLELFLGKVLIQGILPDLCFVAISKHVRQYAVIINCLNQSMDPFAHWLKFFRQRRQCIH